MRLTKKLSHNNKSYYCLVAGLPELSLDSPPQTDVFQILTEIRADISLQDLCSLQMLYTFYDITNLINTVKGNNMPFSALGNLTQDEINDEIEAPEKDELPFVSKLPTAVAAIVDRYKGRVQNEEESEEVAEDQLENQLWLHYYTLAEESKCKFIKQWSATDRAIRNISAAIKARQMGFTLDNITIGTGDVVEQIHSSAAADFGLRGEFEYIEALLSVLQIDDFVERERKMDALRWNIARELTDQDYFNIDYLLGYLVRANLLHRWATLDKSTGSERFREMVNSFTADVKI